MNNLGYQLRFYILFIIGLIIFALFGCGGSSDNNPSSINGSNDNSGDETVPVITALTINPTSTIVDSGGGSISVSISGYIENANEYVNYYLDIYDSCRIVQFDFIGGNFSFDAGETSGTFEIFATVDTSIIEDYIFDISIEESTFTRIFSVESGIDYPPLFEQHQVYNTGGPPDSVAIGDLNGDSYLDLVVAIGYDNWPPDSSYVSVFLNNGDGFYTTPASYNVGAAPSSVVVGDLNNDGHMDIAVANNYSQDISVLLNNGGGTFATSVSYGAGVSPMSIAAGDLNADGYLDLAVANGLKPGPEFGTHTDGNVTVHINNGDGTFAYAVGYEVPDHPFSVTMGDFNGDGSLDFAVANNANDYVSVHLNNGDATFPEMLIIDAGCNYPWSIMTDNLNSDNHIDLIVDCGVCPGNTFSVLLNTGVEYGDFETAAGFYGGCSSMLAVGDLNGDGYSDFATTHCNNVKVFLNKGDGSFIDSLDYEVGSEPSSLAIGDLNNDGYLDIVTGNSDSTNISVLLNNGND